MNLLSKPAMRRTISTALATAALLFAIPRPAAAQAAEATPENLPMVAAPAPKPASKRLPIFGVMADMGLPDGLIGSLTVRPWRWARLSAGGGTNFISGGWRAGITLLPFSAGPSASFEYGRYQDGDANPMAKKFGYGGSPALERVGYQ